MIHRKATTDDLKLIFTLYNQSNFFYPQKKERIMPYIEAVERNWITGLSSNSNLFWTLISEMPGTKKMATLTAWKTNDKSWMAQHLTSNKCPSVVGTMLRKILEDSIASGFYSGQLWFSPGNCQVNKVFTSVFELIRDDTRYIKELCYLDVYPNVLPLPKFPALIVPCQKKNVSDMYTFVMKNRGEIFADAEDLNSEDISLSKLDTEYQKFSLKRRRYCYIAHRNDSAKDIAGVAIAYRGPFGFNLSLLENRCELIIDSSLKKDVLRDVIFSLIHAAKVAYPINKDPSDAFFYPFEFVPVLVESHLRRYFDASFANMFKTYNHCIWLNDGFKEWLEFTKQRYRKVVERANK